MVDQSLSERDKALWWKDDKNGEHGMSSIVLWERLFYPIDSNERNRLNRYHPSDPDDFRRCYLLLETVPEWKEKLHLLKDLSPVWSNLVDNWAELTRLLLEQMAGKKNNMYEFMQTLGC